MSKTLTVHVKPKSKRPSVTEVGDGELIVAVSAAPTDGQANVAVIKALAAHLRVAPSRLTIIRGAKSRRKVIAVE